MICDWPRARPERNSCVPFADGYQPWYWPNRLDSGNLPEK